jgi:hypothetical protein
LDIWVIATSLVFGPIASLFEVLLEPASGAEEGPEAGTAAAKEQGRV